MLSSLNRLPQDLPWPHVPLQHMLRAGNYYLGYTYAYPHKTSYRPLPARSLEHVWHDEPHDHLFLYVHVPFCEMRCGFCNLFTTVHPPERMVQDYLEALARQARVTSQALDGARYARWALGGGTPTYLTADELRRVFAILEDFDIRPEAGASVETSPLTATPDRLAVLKSHGVQRLSLGVQSFIESEVRAVGRRQRNSEVLRALDHIRSSGVPQLNLDLIYGIADQNPDTWAYTLETALRFAPEEVFLYPLYVRPLTGIGKFGRTWDDERLQLYRQGRDTLLAAGYEQLSMRSFRKVGVAEGNHGISRDYCCQQDGMVGLGCGARSYTRGLHYADRFAVSQTEVRHILQANFQRSEADFARVDHGFELDADTQRRRYILQSILHAVGLSGRAYQARFGRLPWDDYPLLKQLLDCGLAQAVGDHWTLTAAGHEMADLIGPWLYADGVTKLMQDFVLA